MACAAAAAGAASPTHAEPAGAPGVGAYTANGPVYSIARASGRTYIGGDFTRVGVRSGTGAVLSPTDGSRGTFPEVAGGDVRAVVSDGQGGWYIGGSFTTVGGQSHVGLAHVLGDGSVDQGFHPAATDLDDRPAAVDAVAYSGGSTSPDYGTLYVGGDFSKVGGEAHAHLAALHGNDGTPITDWGPATGCSAPPACSAAVRALVLAQVPLTVGGATQDVPVLFTGGDFDQAVTSTGSPSVPGVIAVWGVNAVDSSTPPASIAGSLVTDASGNNLWGMSGVQPVRALQVSGAGSTLVVYVGGSGGTARLEARQFKIGDPTHRTIDNRGNLFTNWNPDPSSCDGAGCVSRVNALARDGTTLYFAGDFSTIGAPPPAGQVDAERLASVPIVADPAQTTGGTTTMGTPLGGPGGPAHDGPIRAIAVSGSTLYLGGDFTQRLAALDIASGTATGWAPAPDAPAEALGTDPSTSSVYAGGRFSSLGSVARAGLAAFDSGGALTDWSPGVTRSSGSPLVRALAASDSTVYVGGRFDAVGDPQGASHAHANLAAIDAASGTPIDGFDPAPSGDSAQVLSLSLLDSTLYVGGKFDSIGGQARSNIAALDAGGGAATGWNPGADDNVHALLPACGAVYAGGGFTHAGNGGQQPRKHIAALDPVTGSATGWNPEGADGTVLSLAGYGPTIYAGGNFARIAGQLRQKIAALGTADGTVDAFDPGASGPVRAIATNGTAVYAGGTFTTIGGENRANLAALDPATGDATAWDPSADASVRALAVVGDNVYSGGDFTSVGTLQQAGFAPFTGGASDEPAAPSCEPPAPQPEPPAAQPAPRAATPPARIRVGRLTVNPERLRLGSRKRLMLRFKLSGAAPVRLRFERRVMRRCPRTRRRAHRRRCARYVRFVDVKRRGRRGVNHVVFMRQRVNRRSLVRGRSRITLTLVPKSLGGPKRRAHFEVMRRRR
jgi:hypothetical protein